MINTNFLSSVHGDLFVLLSGYLSSILGVPIFFPSPFSIYLLG
jgi:hypothetical protein